MKSGQPTIYDVPYQVVGQSHYHRGEKAIPSEEVCRDDVRDEERAYYGAENNIKGTERCCAREVFHHIWHRLIERYNTGGKPKYWRLQLSSQNYIRDQPDQKRHTEQPQEDFQEQRPVYVVWDGERELHMNVRACGEWVQAIRFTERQRRDRHHTVNQSDDARDEESLAVGDHLIPDVSEAGSASQ